MSIEKIAQIASLSAAILTVLAIIVAAVICTVRLVKKAKDKSSPGGKKITVEELQEIILTLLPFGAKILEVISKEKKQEEPGEEKKEDYTPRSY